MSNLVFCKVLVVNSGLAKLRPKLASLLYHRVSLSMKVIKLDYEFRIKLNIPRKDKY